MLTRLSEILSARWLIHRGEVLNYLPFFISFLNGSKFNVSDFQDDVTRNKAYAVRGDCGLVGPDDLLNPNLQENFVAVIPIQGVMASWKTQELINNIRMAESNPQISSIFFLVNSPGGMVFLTDLAAQAIKDTPLPTVAFVMNMAASAAMWLVSACDLVVASSQLDRFGSIGVMTSYMDINGLLKEKLNITVYDLYATKSINKNHEVRALLEGDQQPIVDELDFTNEIFHQAIIENRGIDAGSEVLTGSMYNAAKAIEMGLADQIMSLEQAINEAYKMGAKAKITTLINNL